MSSQLTFQFRLLYFLQNLTHWFPLRNTPWLCLYSRSLQHMCIQSALFILHLFICDLVVNATLHPSKCLPSSVIISLFQESTATCSSPQPPFTCSACCPCSCGSLRPALFYLLTCFSWGPGTGTDSGKMLNDCWMDKWTQSVRDVFVQATSTLPSPLGSKCLWMLLKCLTPSRSPSSDPSYTL